MMNSKHVPKRRFSGFDGEWKEIKLYEVVQDFIVPMRDKPKEFSGNIPWTRIDDIEGKYISRSLKGHCVSLETVKSMNLKIIPEDSLIVSASATFGTVAIVKNDLITNQTFIGLVPKNKYEVEFLFYLFQSPKVRNYMKEESAGSTIFYISRESFEKMEIDLPDEKERKLLIKQLCTIDSLITTHQHKLDKLKNLKKAYLSEMFPAEGERVPKRRFTGFEGEWEQKRLTTIASMHARIGWQNLRTSEFLNDGDYYLITGTDFLDGRINFENCYYVDKERYQQDKNIQVKSGSILITKDGTIGKVAIVSHLDKPATLNAGVFNVVIKESNVDEKYLYQYLASPFLMDYVSKRVTGGTIKHLNQGILVDFPINIPVYEEQKAIGRFFEHLDQSITLQQQKLDKLNDLKKAYLNELFV